MASSLKVLKILKTDYPKAGTRSIDTCYLPFTKNSCKNGEENNYEEFEVVVCGICVMVCVYDGSVCCSGVLMVEIVQEVYLVDHAEANW